MIEIEPKKIFSKIMPYSIIFVSSINGDGNPNGLICGWHMKCSINPPLYAVAIKKGKNTEKLILDSEEFVVSFSNKKILHETLYFGTHSGKEFDKFNKTGIITRKSKFLRTPLIEQATINIECFLHETFETGDHTIFIGKVVAAHYKPVENILFYFGKTKNKHRKFREIEK